jgi:hypothetical protein
MPSFKSDQALWYNMGVWGELGYACPNFGDDPATFNHTIHYLTSVIGRNLSAVMHHADADLRTPPSINTLTRLHKLITRARQILQGRGTPPGTPDLEALHSSPASQVFLIFPVPFFKVRNPFLKEYCGLVLNALSEAFQHTENRKPYEISTAFAGLVGQYLHRVYRLMATELFSIPLAEAARLDFALTAENLAGYDPTRFFTSTELIDTVPSLDLVPTEDDLRVLTDGIPATQLVGLARYPSGSPPAGVASAVSPDAVAAPTPAFIPPPGP